MVHLVQDSGYAAGGVGGNIDASVLLAIELAQKDQRVSVELDRQTRGLGLLIGKIKGRSREKNGGKDKQRCRVGRILSI